MTKVAIIDIDNTCVSANERLEGCTKNDEIDWDCAFDNQEIIKDPVIPGAPEAVKKIVDSGFSIIYLTGRSEVCRTGTEQTLAKYGFPQGVSILMRKIGDSRADEELKREVLLALSEQYEIIGAVDDDWSGKLSRMYEELGINHAKTFDEFIAMLEI